MEDVGSIESKIIYDDLREWVNENISPELLEVKFTSTSLLFDQNNRSLLSGMFQGLGLAFFIVSIIMVILFRNFKMVLISLLPNTLPLILTAAIMGFTNVPLDAPATIIFAIAFGIAVDDTIHFLSRYKLELVKGKTKEEAIALSVEQTGKALTLTTAILFVGFISLALSDNTATFKVGYLISITLITALVADLYLLPVFLRMFGKDK